MVVHDDIKFCLQGVAISDNEDETCKPDDPYRMLDINLDE